MSKTQKNIKLHRLFALQLGYKIKATHLHFAQLWEHLLGEIQYLQRIEVDTSEEFYVRLNFKMSFKYCHSFCVLFFCTTCLS